MRRDLDTTQLRTFAAVASLGSMTAAGKQLNLTQAAVSQQIKRLEEQLGIGLFDRTQRTLRMTNDGEQLLGYAGRFLAMNDEIWDLMTSPSFEGEIRLGVPHDIVHPFLTPILKSFSQARPRVKVNMVCTSTPVLLRMLREGEIDLTLTTEPQPVEINNHLMTDRLVWVGARNGQAYKQSTVSVSLGGEECAFRPHAIAAIEASGRNWHINSEDSNMAPMVASLEADLSIAPLLASTVPDGLEIIDDTDKFGKMPSFHINLHLPTDGGDAINKELADHIRRNFAARLRRVA